MTKIHEAIFKNPYATLALYFISDCPHDVLGLHRALSKHLPVLSKCEFVEKPPVSLYRALDPDKMNMESINGFASASRLLECATKFGHDNLMTGFEVWRLNVDSVLGAVSPEAFFNSKLSHEIYDVWPAFRIELEEIRKTDRFLRESESLAIFKPNTTHADIFSTCICKHAGEISHVEAYYA